VNDSLLCCCILPRKVLASRPGFIKLCCWVNFSRCWSTLPGPWFIGGQAAALLLVSALLQAVLGAAQPGGSLGQEGPSEVSPECPARSSACHKDRPGSCSGLGPAAWKTFHDGACMTLLYSLLRLPAVTGRTLRAPVPARRLCPSQAAEASHVTQGPAGLLKEA